MRKNDYSKAKQLFEEVLKINPQKKEALLYKGIVYMDTNEIDEAITVSYNGTIIFLDT